MLQVWKKVENSNGFPYYLNEGTNSKQWDHPKFSEVRQVIDECNYVKYSSYRVALKFRILQHALHMQDVPLTIIAGVFERHRLGNNESSLTLESCDLEAVLSDIYFAANKKNHTNTDIDFATELMLNFLYNVYDEKREGKIQVSSARITLAILSNSSLLELYKFMFCLCADHNNCVTRLRLRSLLLKIVEIIKFLHEDACFGAHLVNSSIENCFNNSPGLVGAAESTFMSWLESCPQILGWISLLHRVRSAESVVHMVKCNSCQSNPIMGLKYRCIKCTRYIQCQRCFFTGRTSHSHKLSHSMREYCVSQEVNRMHHSYSFFKQVCGLFCPRQLKNTNISLVHTQPLRSSRSELFKTTQSSENMLCNIEPLSSPQTQLQVIIRQLEMQNKELQNILSCGDQNDKELWRYLEDHRIHMAGQIDKLRILKDCIRNSENKPLSKATGQMYESTPVVNPDLPKIAHRNIGLELFSPIIKENDDENKDNLSDTSIFKGYNSYNVNKQDSNTLFYCIDDISTWIGGHPDGIDHQISPVKSTCSEKPPMKEIRNDLDEALAKLQQILANNFSLEDSLNVVDNSHLKHAVTEVEGVITSIIDNVESGRSSSVPPLQK